MSMVVVVLGQATVMDETVRQTVIITALRPFSNLLFLTREFEIKDTHPGKAKNNEWLLLLFCFCIVLVHSLTMQEARKCGKT